MALMRSFVSWPLDARRRFIIFKPLLHLKVEGLRVLLLVRLAKGVPLDKLPEGIPLNMGANTKINTMQRVHTYALQAQPKN